MTNMTGSKLPIFSHSEKITNQIKSNKFYLKCVIDISTLNKTYLIWFDLLFSRSVKIWAVYFRTYWSYKNAFIWTTYVIIKINFNYYEIWIIAKLIKLYQKYIYYIRSNAMKLWKESLNSDQWSTIPPKSTKRTTR
jgi:hypothetical protein